MRIWLPDFGWLSLFRVNVPQDPVSWFGHPVEGFVRSLNIHVVDIGIPMDLLSYMYQDQVSFLNLWVIVYNIITYIIYIIYYKHCSFAKTAESASWSHRISWCGALSLDISAKLGWKNISSWTRRALCLLTGSSSREGISGGASEDSIHFLGFIRTRTRSFQILIIYYY